MRTGVNWSSVPAAGENTLPRFEDVKEQAPLKDYAAAKLEQVRGGYVCPVCGSGTGQSKTPALSIKGEQWKCFSCCNGGDVFDMAAFVENLDPSDRKSHLITVAEWAGISAVSGTPNKPVKASKVKPAPMTPDYMEARKAEAEQVRRWRSALPESEGFRYITGRGFTGDEAIELGFGYDAQRNRLIIPWRGTEYYHIDRVLNHDGKGKYHKPKSDLLGKQPLYNPEALNSEAFFVVEGALDALAVEAMGFEAVALGGTAYTDLMAALSTKRYGGTVIPYLDNDAVGHSTAGKLHDELAAAGIASHGVTFFDDTPKDATEWLSIDRESLRSFLSREYSGAIQKAEESKNRAYTDALARLRVMDAASVVTDLFTLADEPETIPTGITSLDRVLDGGLTRGVYVLGAVSSLGKTTLATHIADNIAESGRSILFVTIEQSGQEIMAKCLSRRMHERGYTVSTNEIQRSSARAYWNDTKSLEFLNVCEYFTGHVAPHFHMLEGISQPTVADIAAVASTIADHDGRSPVIFIDYLQLLKPSNERDTDKQAVDRNMIALRQLAGRDLKTPVFCISSLNRSSYSGIVTLDSFKESGAIEYGADVLLGLEPRGMADELESTDEKKVKRKADRLTRESKDMLKRECEITILKNRSGRTPKDGIPLTFDVLASAFLED